MTLDKAAVAKVAELARLSFADDELEVMTKDLSAIVDFVEQLQAVNTDGVEPISNVAGLVNVTRADKIGHMFSQAEALQNAPDATHEAFLVPKAVERS